MLGSPNTAAPRCPFPSPILRHVTAETPRDTMRFWPVRAWGAWQPCRVLTSAGPITDSSRARSCRSERPVPLNLLAPSDCVYNINVLHLHSICATSGNLLEIRDYILGLAVAPWKIGLISATCSQTFSITLRYIANNEYVDRFSCSPSCSTGSASIGVA